MSDPEIAIVGVGCSIGAAVLWTYTELFTDADFAGLVFVDQAPLQNRSLAGGSNWDARFAHRSCYDAATLAAAQTLWAGGSEAAFVGLVDGCLGYRFAPLGSDDVSAERRVADEAFFVGEAKRCDGAWLAALMGDHTVYDHREACEGIRVPVLVMAGKRTGCFPLEGMREVVRRVEKGCVDRGVAGMKSSVAWSEFDGGHWLFWEEPDRFNREVIAFVKECVQE